MKSFVKHKPIGGLDELIQNIQNKIDLTISEFNIYSEYLGDTKFMEIPNEKEGKKIDRTEGTYDRLDEMIKRNKLVLKNGKETIDLIDNIKSKIESVVESCENDEYNLEKKHNELIDSIVELEERKMNEEIKPLKDKINEISKQFNNRKKELETRKINTEKIIEKIEKRKWRLQPMGQIINFEEIKQIEEWTKMKIDNVLFDSNVDNWSRIIDDWNVDSSIFCERIMNKSNLIFIIEEEDGNKFGGYVNACIDKYHDYINDPKSFVFSLNSNGRLRGMMKFDNCIPQFGFYLSGQSNICLCGFGCGHDICIYEKNNKNESYCSQTSFDYNGIENALCGKYNFTPKRITVIQLI